MNDKRYKERCDEVLLSRGKKGGTPIDAYGKSTEDILNILTLEFQKNEFKKAKEWLLDHNYPLDLIKYIDNFTIVDLANLMFEAESVAYNQDIYFKKLIERMDTASELIDIPNSINSPKDSL